MKVFRTLQIKILFPFFILVHSKTHMHRLCCNMVRFWSNRDGEISMSPEWLFSIKLVFFRMHKTEILKNHHLILSFWQNGFHAASPVFSYR